MNTARPVGNQRQKLCMTTAAMSVLPRPVGSETSVLCRTATAAMSNWYLRVAYTADSGYSHVPISSGSYCCDGGGGVSGRHGGGGRPGGPPLGAPPPIGQNCC
eukprot:7381598-Prymnesium_polylepis.1